MSTPDTTVGVISDTHGLLRPEAIEALRGVALILHAGDVGSRVVLERLRDVAPTIAVRGNVDTEAWAGRLRETEAVEVGSIRLYMLHELSKLDLDPATAGFAVVLSGHSHRPAADTRDGVLYLNPGAAGPRRFSLPITVARLRVTGREVSHDIIELRV